MGAIADAVSRAAPLAPGAPVGAAELVGPPRTARVPRIEDMTLEEAEKYLIDRAMRRAGSGTEAGRLLGLSRSAPHRRPRHFWLRDGTPPASPERGRRSGGE